MSSITAAIRLAFCAGLLALVAACSNIDRNHGYVPPDDVLNQIVVGVDTRETVAEVVGRPSASGILDAGGWYYVKSKFRAYGFRQRQEIDREVVAISFDRDGVVENIERFGLEDGRVITISRRVTDSNIKGISFLRQLFGSFGNFTADQLLN
ncbi:outer membrane protein assembly factor BamE [Psychromarinibacter sp. C21-152]|uniref:Outer membrane protein assembly factor BamE n=1 Tax=Psychromarinibacter sediminicola TaxID=3033385 RepID=A0AAE3T8F9_9RHOB|nr:outer membrane protein assembly factor BamE [Psychromarinibacter sediminicola]MDF0600024.1 outer membrane protein assembly factor BamE [Psychromarinibacter sediminicola]